MLTNSDIVDLTAFRRNLHRHPEVSGEEEKTAQTIATALSALAPTQIITGLGGHGVAAVFDSGVAGPTVLFRAELDALPIQEINDIDWASLEAGKSHVCGHDGHMTMLLALGHMISRTPITKGRVVLMFQPAEEDGSGAKAVVSDPKFKVVKPDWAFAIHNLPGLPTGHIATRSGLINCASQGLAIRLTGKTAHAANPEDGVSPARAVARLIPALDDLGAGGALGEEFRLVTITHVNIGEPTFGVAPGEALINVTLRTTSDADIAELSQAARALASASAEQHGLQVNFDTCDEFAASVNDPEAVNIAVAAMNALEIPHCCDGIPMHASEDFGVFGWNAKAAMLCLGSGTNQPALHNPDFDFPDDLIPVGSAIFERIARDLLG